ncbi:NDR1/HIN1-like protein 13 [Impatiens glandulifera]|uniref:NDR1/HIN1-like protein 13 n=1 Tax=Impatiens glandulifera TaxID=253017 RepID=UPI001FB1A0BF|nr:NDR1/HIN1-like protein 13 [Impatiens glandulifera]
MADRVHPIPTHTDTTPVTVSGDMSELPKQPSQPITEKPVISPGTYVIQIPKDQIYKYPPPENAHRQRLYARKGISRRRTCRRCLCYTFGILALLVFLLGITAGILYLVFKPESPKYSIETVAIRGFNLTSSSSISPEFDVTVRAENPNNKIRIYYQKGSAVTAYYSNVELANGVLPAFHQGSNNLTIFQTTLKGSGILLTGAMNSEITAGAKEGKVLMKVNIRAPVKVKIGAVKTWKITVKVNCDVTVDSLTAAAKIVSRDCKYKVRLW